MFFSNELWYFTVAKIVIIKRKDDVFSSFVEFNILIAHSFEMNTALRIQHM